MNTIDEKTIARIEELGDLIAASSEELERLVRDLSAGADAVMYAAARKFAERYEAGPNPITADYNEAHDRLLKAAVAASNLKEKARRANTLRSRCTPWASTGGHGGQEKRDIDFVLADLATLDLESKQD